jgi:Ca-activated chloride channel family protein
MNAILAALIDGAMVSALVTAAVWLGMLAASRLLNAATRYLVWWAALVLAVILPVFYLPGRPAPRVEGASPQPVALTPFSPRESRGPDRTARRVAAAETAAPSARPRLPIGITVGRVPQWMGAAWVVAAVLMLLRLAMSWVVLGRRKARASGAPGHLSARLETWLRQCGSARRRVRLAVSAEIATPMVAGLRHPAILIPAPFLEALDEAELDQIGLHEAAHLARGDDAALIVQRIAEALFALDPVVRWIARRIDLEREIACDDFVVQATGRPRPYAACLTRVAELTGGVRSSLVAAAAADERSHLTRRVDMLLDKSRHTGTRPLKARFAAVAAALAAMAWMAARAPGVIAFAMPMPPDFPAAAAAVIEPPQTPAPPEAQTGEAPPQLAPAPQAPPRPLAPAASQTTGVAAVSIQVAVTDPRNRFVTGLDKANFRLFEDGVEQEIARFSTADLPLSVGLVIDTSGSMRTKFGQVEQAVQQFLKIANPQDEFFVVQFNEEARLAIGFTGDGDEIQRQIAQVRPNGGTALFDAIDLAMRQMGEAHNQRKAILAITDTGSDNSSTDVAGVFRKLNRMLEFLQAHVPVYAMSIADTTDPPAQLLTGLTEQTGGRHFTLGDATSMADVASRIAVELRNLYLLEYVPRNPAHDGAFRKLHIELLPPQGLPPLKLDSRAGYYAPRQ